MIPYRGDRFDHFNNGQSIHRHMVPVPQQPPHIVQPPSLMYTTSAPNFHQHYASNLPMQQPTVMFVASRPHPQQSWIVSNGPPPVSAPSMPPYMPPPPLPPPPPTFHHVQPPFTGTNNLSQSLLNHVPGIPQPPFSGGTSVLKRKSHFLEESDIDLPNNSKFETNKELPPLMSIPTQSFPNKQLQLPQHHHYQIANPRYIDNNSTTLRHPPVPPGSCIPPTSVEPFNHQISHPHWTNSDRNTYPIIPPLVHSNQHEQNQQKQVLTSQLFQKHQFIPIDTILKEPGRSQRAAQIIVFLRGLPGSGKSYVADLIKNEEETHSKGTNKPKILSIDNYFLNENQRETKDPKTGKITKTTVMEYDYESKMEETYRKSLIKLVRKSIDDRFYPFLIVDQNNEQIGHFRDMADYAEANQFQVYFVELNNDVQTCTQRNIHNRSLSDIEEIHKRWEQLPLRYEILDIRSLLQSDAIEEVEMDDAPPAAAATTTTSTEQNETEEEESQITKKSKWEAMMETNPDRLDGLYQRRTTSASPTLEKLSNNISTSVEEQTNDESPNCESKKKKVRWADIEENVLHLHKRAVGFVVGQTEQDWQRMSDDYDPSQKLNQYKYI